MTTAKKDEKTARRRGSGTAALRIVCMLEGSVLSWKLDSKPTRPHFSHALIKNTFNFLATVFFFNVFVVAIVKVKMLQDIQSFKNKTSKFMLP